MQKLKRTSKTVLFLTMALLFCLCMQLTSCFHNAPKTETSLDVASEKGGSVIVGITQEPGLFDPHKASSAGDREILFNIYEGLVKCTPEGDFVPALATDCVVSEDGRSYTFTLRSGVKFHNGQVLTEKDVIYSLSRAAGFFAADEKPLVSTMENVQSVTEEDGKIVVGLKNPDSAMLAFFTVAIIPENYEDLEKNPVGTGPFKWRAYTVGQSVELLKNEDYWIEGIPYLDKATFKITADMDAAFLELLGGSIDIFPYLTVEKANQLENQYEIVSAPSNMIHVWALNNQEEPFTHPKVREALNYAIDRESLILQVMGISDNIPLSGAMSPTMGDYYNTDLDNGFSYDVEKAKALLSEAGYPDGFSTTVTVPSNYLIHVDTAVIIKQQLKEVGIELEILQVDWPTWKSDIYAGRQYMSTVVAVDSEYHPADVLSRYVSNASDNFINYKNEDFDRIYALAISESDPETRIALYHDLQKFLYEDAASVYLQDPTTLVAVKKELAGYFVYPIYVQDLSTVYYK